jgi:hypothetical protein
MSIDSQPPSGGMGDVKKIVESPTGRVMSADRKTDKTAIAQAFSNRQDRLSPVTEQGPANRDTYGASGIITEQIVHANVDPDDTPSPAKNEIDAVSSPREASINTHQPEATQPADNTNHLATESTISADPQSEIATAAEQLAKPDGEIKPTSDSELTFESEVQRKEQEAQNAWIDVINTMTDNKGEHPYFATLGTKGNSSLDEKRALILIKSTHNPSDPNAEVYLAITKDGPQMMDATKEVKTLVSKLFLNPKEATPEELNILEKTLLIKNDYLDSVTPIIEGSKDIAKTVKKVREKVEALVSSKARADELNKLLKPQQTPLT